MKGIARRDVIELGQEGATIWLERAKSATVRRAPSPRVNGNTQRAKGNTAHSREAARRIGRSDCSSRWAFLGAFLKPRGSLSDPRKPTGSLLASTALGPPPLPACAQRGGRARQLSWAPRGAAIGPKSVAAAERTAVHRFPSRSVPNNCACLPSRTETRQLFSSA